MELVAKNLSHDPNNVPSSSSMNSSTETLLAGLLESFPASQFNTDLIHVAQIPLPGPHDHRMNRMFSSPSTSQMLQRSSRLSQASSNSSINCGGRCDNNASNRCLDCMNNASNRCIDCNEFMCDLHNEYYRYVCEYCMKLVCQCCTLREHKDHNYTSIESFVEESKEKIILSMEGSRMGTKCVKGSIDKVLGFIRLADRNCNDMSDQIRRSFRQLMIAIEDRERFLLDFVEKLRQRRLNILHDQMAGLKSILSGLSETSQMLQKVYEITHLMNQIEIALKITSGQRQLEQFAAIFNDLQPRQETYAFVVPDINVLGIIRNQGNIIVIDDYNMSIEPGALVPVTVTPGLPIHSAMTVASRRPILRDANYRIPTPVLQRISNPGLDWELGLLSAPPAIKFGPPKVTQCIAGSSDHIKVRNSNVLTMAFATEGHEDGQVSRPWGLCVDKMGNFLISDRRNNRVQVYNPNGTFKFKFGRKGVGNAEFDLPTGICTDCDNRIIVVDKDNHRVQIFSANGVFLSKFGSFGREYGQFQYPWDVAVNSRRQIVVTDSRNHRIQQFDSEGRFIRHTVFNNNGPFRSIVAPRGICYTPQGNIIVSDFDNHRLYLIDPDANVIISSKGHEGCGIHEFNRPSGLCCDDDGRIIVADSKNRRVIVFSPNMDYLWDNPNGTFKFKFGRKGVGNAEFDLPAGICTDCDNRIIVMDKDNHRVQIFSANGVFLSKFGTFGKDYGQFQYPWDVAVNSRRQIVVTDSRNHRIQQFDSEGRFIRHTVFGNNGPSKSIAAPRGICYTPQGNIIVSDFDNHRLYLIDPDANVIISSKGHEGYGFQVFNRPSGLCCDDDGRIIVADSKNQRVIVFSPNMDYLWDIDIRTSVKLQMPYTVDEKDRICDVALMPDGRVVFLIELSPDSKEGSNPHKRFINVY